MGFVFCLSSGKTKAVAAVDAARSRASVLLKLRDEQDASASTKHEWIPQGDSGTVGGELHAVDSDLLHQGKDITWLQRMTTMVRAA